ncbi:MAG TPA: MarC family protein [Gammaproteobacteria bacterium]
MTVYSAALLLFLVIDPLANIPFFLTALKEVKPKRHKAIILRELLIALAVMVSFLFAGRYLLRLLQISEPALSIAGGIILFLIAVKMIFPPQRGGLHEEIQGEPFVFPLAIPFIAGPSALATILLLSSREPERWGDWLMALLLAWAAAAVILYSGIDRLARLMGPRGLIAVERLMGMLLTLIAVQMFMSGIKMFPGI